MNRRLIASVCLTPLLVIGSCGKQYDLAKQRDDILDKPTPELVTNSERKVDIENQDAMTTDTNMRALRSDWRRAWLLNRSSRLTPEPVR